MTLKQAWPGVSGKAQVLDIRNDLAGMLIRQGVLASASDGAVPAVPLLNKSNTLTPSVREFHAIIKRPNRADGSQMIYNDGPTGAFPAFGSAPQTGTRLDLLWVKAFDTLYDDRGNVEFGITPGTSTTGTAQANRAAMPEGALELGTLLMPAGATTLNSAGVVWTDTYQYGAIRGVNFFVRTEAELTSALQALLPLGQQVTSLDTQCTFEVGFGFGNANRGFYPVSGNMPRLYMDRHPTAGAITQSGAPFPMDTQYVYDVTTQQLRSITMDTYGKRLTIPYDGLYRLQGQLIFVTNGTGSRAMFFLRNIGNPENPTDGDCSVFSAAWGESAGSGAMGGFVSVDKEVFLRKGDVITIAGRQSSGGTLAIPGGTNNRQVKGGTYAMIEYIAPPRGITPPVVG